MFLKPLFFILICLMMIQESHPLPRNYQYNATKSKNTTQHPKRTSSRYHFTSGLIIFFVILFMVIFLYGTRFYFVIKMHFFERRERKYVKMDKMDLTSNVV